MFDYLADDRGFSIIELIVVGAIIAILATVAVPQMASTMRDFRVTQSTNAVLGTLRTARANAIKEQREVRAVVDLDDERITFEICSGPGDCDSDSDLSFVNYKDMQATSVMEGVDLYGLRHQLTHGSSSDWHYSKSGVHPIEFPPTGTKQQAYLLMTYKPPPAEDDSNACDFTTIIQMATGQPRIVRSLNDSHTDQSFAAYVDAPFDFKWSSVPDCAK